jgi:hypothetical protein
MVRGGGSARPDTWTKCPAQILSRACGSHVRAWRRRGSGIHAPGVQRGVRAVRVRGVRAVLCAVSVRGGSARVYERVSGWEGQRDGHSEPLLPADGVRGRTLVRGVSTVFLVGHVEALDDVYLEN